MRIGFATIYSWRPHVEHLYFLATLARKAGHEAFFLTCDSDLPTCYTRELRDKPAWRECLECRVGGIRSFASQGVSSLGKYLHGAGAGTEVPAEWAHSSASTLGRFESNADYASEEFAALAARLHPVVRLTYHAARNWMRDKALDAVCVFNGRIDATRAIFEAAQASGIRTVSLERTWFGDGIQLFPGEICLGQRSVHTLVAAWKDRPLTRMQAAKAAAIVAARFLRSNVREWRAYNTNARNVPWPIEAAGRRKILLLPSSRNELWGHADWAPQWSDTTDAYEALMAHLHLEPRDLVLRCHPNWGEMIGRRDGARCEAHYTAWARRAGVLCIPSADTSSTLALIEQCDAIVVAHGSAAFEAGILGKQVIATAPSFYRDADLCDAAYTSADLASLHLQANLPAVQRAARAEHVARQTLRFCYTLAFRVAQYTAFVKAEATTRFGYDFDANPQRFIDLLRGGSLTADDSTWADDLQGENEVLELIRARQWEVLQAPAAGETRGRYRPLRRRLLLRPVDRIRRQNPPGDRLTLRDQRS